SWLQAVIPATRSRLEGKLDFIRRILRVMNQDGVKPFVTENFLSIPDNQSAEESEVGHKPHFVDIDGAGKRELARYLAAEGLLEVEKPDLDRFCIPSPMIRSVLIQSVLPPPRSFKRVPPVRDGKLDVITLLR